MTSPTSATAPVSPPLSSPCSPGTIDNNHCTNKQPQPRVGASFSLPSYLVVDEIDLKLHLQHQQQQLKQPQPHHSGNGIEIVTNNNINSNTHTIHQGHSPERIQGVIMNKQQLKDLSNHHHHHPMHPPLSQNKRSKRRQRSAHSPPSSPDEDAIPTTIGGTSSSPTEEYKACPCCRRYIRLGEFCSSSRRGCGETSSSSLSYSQSSWGSVVVSDGNGWSSSLRSVDGGAGIERVGVAGRNGSVCGRSMAEYSMDTTEEDVVGVLTERGRKDDRRQSNSSRPDGDDDHSTVLAGLSLESSDDDDDDDDTATNIREDGTDSIGVSLIQGVAFPGVDRIARGLPDGSYGDAAEGPSTKDPRVIMIRESVNPIHCGGGLAAYDVKEYLKMSDRKKKTQTTNHGYSGGNTCVGYTVTKTIVQGWLHKKGTGNDFLGMRWWKPRWVTLALAQIPGHLVETPILLTHRAPGVPFPPNVIVLSENTVVMAIERTNAAEYTHHHPHDPRKQRQQQPQPSPSQRHDGNPLDRLVNLTDMGHHPRDELGNQPIKEEWNTHCFQIVNTESHPSVSRIFTAPRKERNEWVFAIHRAIMEYEKRLAKARWRLQRPRSPSPVRMDANESTTTTKTDSSGGGSAGGGRGNGRRAGLPPTSPRRVRSPSPVSSRRDDGNAYRRNHHNADVGGGGMKNDQRLTVTP